MRPLLLSVPFVLIGCPATTPVSPVATDDPATLTTCGDGFLEGLEECDDGNAVDMDGCSVDCVLENDILVTTLPYVEPTDLFVDGLGRPVIVHEGGLIRCADLACTDRSEFDLAALGIEGGKLLDVVLDPQGAVTYTWWDRPHLLVQRLDSDESLHLPEAAQARGTPDIELGFGPEGWPVLLYGLLRTGFDVSTIDVKLARCLDAQCQANTETLLAEVTGPGTGGIPAPAVPTVTLHMVTDSQGIPSLSIGERFVRCHDAACGAFTETPLSSGVPSQLAIAANGLPLLRFGASLVHCADKDCLSQSEVQQGISDVLLSDPPHLAWSLPAASGGWEVGLFRCHDRGCMEVSRSVPVERLATGSEPKVALRPDGDALLVYPAGDTLRVAHVTPR